MIYSKYLTGEGTRVSSPVSFMYTKGASKPANLQREQLYKLFASNASLNDGIKRQFLSIIFMKAIEYKNVESKPH